MIELFPTAGLFSTIDVVTNLFTKLAKNDDQANNSSFLNTLDLFFQMLCVGFNQRRMVRNMVLKNFSKKCGSQICCPYKMSNFLLCLKTLLLRKIDSKSLNSKVLTLNSVLVNSFVYLAFEGNSVSFQNGMNLSSDFSYTRFRNCGSF